MSPSVAPTLSKWPFLLADALLLVLAAVFAFRGPGPISLWQGVLCLAATAVGGWFCVLPFIKEHAAALQLSEADALASTVVQIGNLEQIKQQITNATGQWQGIQDQSAQTVAAAKEVSDRMKAELEEFCAFLQKAHDTEKNHLKLEVEKLRRGERDWLQATVLMLDHVHALHTAAVRSGQPTLVAQLDQFQFACRDSVRRLGLNPFAPALHERFDAQAHQLDNEETIIEGESEISEVLAVGYTFQGQLVRRALVRVQPKTAVMAELPLS